MIRGASRDRRPRLLPSYTSLDRFAPAGIAGRPFVSQLNIMSVDDGGDQAGEALIDFCATRSVLHFNTAAFPSDQACFSEGFEVLREGRFGDGPFADVYEIGTVLRTLRACDISEYRDAHRVRERVKNPFHGNVFD